MKKLEVEEIVDYICSKFQDIKQEYLYLIDCYMHFDDYLHNVEKYNFIYVDSGKIRYLTYEFKEIELESVDEITFKVIGNEKESIKEQSREEFERDLSKHTLSEYENFNNKINTLKNIRAF